MTPALAVEPNALRAVRLIGWLGMAGLLMASVVLAMMDCFAASTFVSRRGR